MADTNESRNENQVSNANSTTLDNAITEALADAGSVTGADRLGDPPQRVRTERRTTIVGVSDPGADTGPADGLVASAGGVEVTYTEAELAAWRTGIVSVPARALIVFRSLTLDRLGLR